MTKSKCVMHYATDNESLYKILHKKDSEISIVSGSKGYTLTNLTVLDSQETDYQYMICLEGNLLFTEVNDNELTIEKRQDYLKSEMNY